MVHVYVCLSVCAGKWTGVVTTTRVTHATPASSYAHTAHRDWEGSIPEDQALLCPDLKDIADQLIHDTDMRVGYDANTYILGNQ